MRVVEAPDACDEATVLMAFEPRIYRKTIGEVVRELRPCLEVVVADPDDEFEARLDSADVAICDCPEISERDAMVSWIEVRPYSKLLPGFALAAADMNWRRSGCTILYVIDEAQRLACTNESFPLDGSEDVEVVPM